MATSYPLDEAVAPPAVLVGPDGGILYHSHQATMNERRARNALPTGLAGIAIALTIFAGHLEALPFPHDEFTQDAMRIALFSVALALTGISGAMLSINAMCREAPETPSSEFVDCNTASRNS